MTNNDYQDYNMRYGWQEAMKKTVLNWINGWLIGWSLINNKSSSSSLKINQLIIN